jgi:hypothetical protein
MTVRTARRCCHSGSAPAALLLWQQPGAPSANGALSVLASVLL